jgi:hypothetical protein
MGGPGGYGGYGMGGGGRRGGEEPKDPGQELLKWEEACKAAKAEVARLRVGDGFVCLCVCVNV